MSAVDREIRVAADNLRDAGENTSAELVDKARAVLSLKAGNPPAERLAAITAGACLTLAAELIDEEGGS